MKTRIILAGLLAILCSYAADAADWYDNIGPSMGRIEVWSDGTIWLMRDGSTVSISGHSSSCTVNQIHLIPPSGREKDWLAMLLSATAAGNAINIYGDCISAGTRIDASRFVVAY